MKQRKPWTPQQDKVLKYLRQVEKIQKWSMIARLMVQDHNLPQRSGKQCRQRYSNHLDSQINHDQWNEQQQKILYQLHSENGNRWTLMANKIKGRTQNCIKNHFYSRLRKSIRRINKFIIQRYKMEYKQIKLSVLYKIIQLAEDKYRPGKSVDPILIDVCTDIKNRLFTYQDDIVQDNKQEQITHELILEIQQIEHSLKKLSKEERNSSGFLNPKLPIKFKASASIDSSEFSSINDSSLNSSLFKDGSEDNSTDAPLLKNKLTQSMEYTSHIRKGSFLENQNVQIGSNILQKSLDLQKYTRSQRSFNWDLNSDRISDIDGSKCLSDIENKEDEDFQFEDSDLIKMVPEYQMEEFNNQNYFQDPNFTEFPPIRVISPKNSEKSRESMNEQI